MAVPSQKKFDGLSLSPRRPSSQMKHYGPSMSTGASIMACPVIALRCSSGSRYSRGLQGVHRTNNSGVSYKVGLNHFADMDEAEIPRGFVPGL
jgi:hypothetical protein